MADPITCASCASTKSLKQCARCKTISYCSKPCHRTHWQTHKRSCHFRVVLTSHQQVTTPADPLSLLRAIPDPGNNQQLPDVSTVVQRLFNIPELRLAVLSLLPATELLRTQRVCRSWYLTSALELKLQQRLFLSRGPSELVVASQKCESRFEDF
jgi:hypothetical protein